MVRSVIWSLVTVSAILMIYSTFGGPFNSMLDAYDTASATVSNSNFTNWWGRTRLILDNAFWIAMVLDVIAVILWLWLKSTEREYYTAGGWQLA